MDDHGTQHWRDSWLRWSIASVCGMAAAAVLVGFVWLPSAQSDFGAQGLWASICRAAGVPGNWGERATDLGLEVRSTSVVLDVHMARVVKGNAIGRGATLAQSCTGCHGARGLGEGSAPNLAGLGAEVIVKQLKDYQQGDRSSTVMQAFAKNLSERDMFELAAYYAYLPPWRSSSDDSAVIAPILVSVGAPMRNIAPCASCHEGVERKLGAPRLEGMPKDYLTAQLRNFARGLRKNDSHAQMRNMARRLSEPEIEALARYYARPQAASQTSARQDKSGG